VYTEYTYCCPTIPPISAPRKPSGNRSCAFPRTFPWPDTTASPDPDAEAPADHRSPEERSDGGAGREAVDRAAGAAGGRRGGGRHRSRGADQGLDGGLVRRVVSHRRYIQQKLPVSAAFAVCFLLQPYPNSAISRRISATDAGPAELWYSTLPGASPERRPF